MAFQMLLCSVLFYYAYWPQSVDVRLFLRPTTVIRDTYHNIKETEYFTINHIHEAILNAAHHTSGKYDHSISEFDMIALEEDL